MVTWTSTAGGSWSVAANWTTAGSPATHAVPQAGDDVVIDQPGDISITLSGGVSVNSVTLTGDTLELQARAMLTTAGAVSNGGTITVDASAQLVVGGSYMESAGASLLMPGGGSRTQPVSNQFVNSDFEAPAITTNGTTRPGNWAAWGSSYLSRQYAYSGSQSLQTSGPNSGVLQSFSVTPGDSYTLSAYAMTPASDPLTGSEEGSLQLIFYTSGGTQISTYSPPNSVQELSAASATGGPIAGSVGGQGWNQFSTTAVAPSNAASVSAILGVGAYNGSGAGGGSVYWDAPQFGPAAPGPSNVTAASVSNSGIITIGPSNTLTSSGTFRQTSTGTLDVQLGGSPSSGAYGYVSSSGAASLAGTLKSDILYGYVPATTDAFTVMEYSSETGNFATYSLPGGSGTQFQGAVTFTNVMLAAEPTAALTTTVNAAANLHAVNADLLGTNLAWWYGDATTSQTQQMVEQAGLNIYRFPGGSSSDDYHFNSSTASGDAYAETIPQFAQFIQAAGGTGMITLDYGSGSPQEAAAEMAYLLGSPSDTTTIGTGIEWSDSSGAWQNVNWGTVGYWASLRAASPLGTDDGLNFLRIDHPAPFNDIKYWEVGNEEYGSWEIDRHGTAGPGSVSTGAQHDPATYAAFAKAFSTYAAEIVTNARLPAISIGIDSGDPTGASDNNWTRNVLADGFAIGFVPNYISDHSYMQGPGAENDSFLLNDTVSDPSSIDDWSTRYADYQTMLQQTLFSQASGVVVMATEFNSVYSSPGKQSTSLVNGLFVADSIGGLLDAGYSGGIVWDLRNGYDTTQNNSEALYGWRNGGDYGILGDPGFNQAPTSAAYVPYPSYFAEQLASKMIEAGSQVESASSNYQDLHAYAAMEADGHLDLLVINTNPAASLADQFNLSGFQPSGAAEFWQYGEAQDTAQSQSSTGAAALASSSTTLALTGSSFSYSFPAYSMTVIDLTPAAPAVASLSPSRGPTTGGTSVVIAGSSFTGATAVTFGGLPASSFTVNSATQITAVDPANSAAGPVDVQVTAPGGTSGKVTSDQFTYVAPPTVVSVTTNDGETDGNTTQASDVRQLVVTFSEAVNLTQPGAFSLGVYNLNGTGGAVSGNGSNDGSITNISSVLNTATSTDGGVTWTITFAPGTANTDASASLIDGIYSFSINNSDVMSNGVALTGSNTYTFHRLYGDVTGTGAVNNTDARDFSNAYGAPAGSANYNAAFDFGGTGANINNTDARDFSLRYGQTFSSVLPAGGIN